MYELVYSDEFQSTCDTQSAVQPDWNAVYGLIRIELNVRSSQAPIACRCLPFPSSFCHCLSEKNIPAQSRIIVSAQSRAESPNTRTETDGLLNLLSPRTTSMIRTTAVLSCYRLMMNAHPRVIISQWTYLAAPPINTIQSEPLEVTAIVHTVVITFLHHSIIRIGRYHAHPSPEIQDTCSTVKLKSSHCKSTAPLSSPTLTGPPS